MATSVSTPRTLIHDDSTWLAFQSGTRARPESAAILKAEAEAALAQKRITLVDKPKPAPSGDLHDYVSQAPYWWPDPAQPDGLPYIRRDGEVNPEYHASDRTTMEQMCAALSALVLHSKVDGTGDHAHHAGRLLRGWFLDPATRMNPHLRYAQRIPGICDGRGIGIIDTNALCLLLETVTHLDFNEDWTPAHLAGLKDWFAAYLDWLLTSDHGRDECNEHNNHGTWYDAQVACYALFCGRDDVARRQITQFSLDRIARQIAPDGSQPHELARTLSFSYSTFNLIGFALLARIARHFEIDLWRHATRESGSLIAAIDWMLPFLLGERSWTWPQIDTYNPTLAPLLLSLAAQGTGETRFAHAYDALAQNPWDRVAALKPGVRTSRQSRPR
ncbi:alginate lyase [Opitutaceae bacterium TAV4]|nr:alginate lyase [Opitutaceae bacterium TAV4]RRJ99853.1 alginate lyase [Opitutaceae bacterium TAV3]